MGNFENTAGAELKPCPWCGSTSVQAHSYPKGREIECKTCGFNISLGKSRPDTEVDSAWNVLRMIRDNVYSLRTENDGLRSLQSISNAMIERLAESEKRLREAFESLQELAERNPFCAIGHALEHEINIAQPKTSGSLDYSDKCELWKTDDCPDGIVEGDCDRCPPYLCK